MAQKTRQILEQDEKILWQGGISRALLGFKIFLFILFLSFLIFLQTSWNLILILFLFASVYFAYQLIKKFYLTDKRILFKSGLIGTDFKSIYFDEIRSTDLRVDLIDKIFSIGTISINIGLIPSAGKSASFSHLPIIKLPHLDDCYLVYQKFQEAMSGYKEKLYGGRK